MIPLTRKLLVSSAFLILSSSHMTFSMDEKITANGNRTQTLTQEAAPEFAYNVSPEIDKTQPTKPLSWTSSLEIPKLFVTSFFEPIIEDAPKVLMLLQQQMKKVKEEGPLPYAIKVGQSIVRGTRENPLDAVIMTGAMALGWTNVAEYSTLFPLTVGVAGGVKNGQLIYDLAASMGGKTVLTKSLQIGLYGAAIYAAASLPVSYALSTVTLGPEFQINQNALSTGTPSATAGLTNGAVVVSWPNSANNIVARIFYPNGTAITSEFAVSAAATSSQVTPSVAGLTGGNWIATWQGGTTTILSRIFSPTGTAITSPFATNQNTYTNMGGGTATGLINGNALVVWGGSSPGTYLLPGRIFSPNGTPLSNEFNINQITTNVIGDVSVTGLANGNALVAWNTNTIEGRILYDNGTAAANEFTANQATNSPLSSVSTTQFVDGNILAVYSNQNDIILGRVIQNGAPSGNEFQIEDSGGYGIDPSATMLGDGNALVLWQNGTVAGKVLSLNGTILSEQFNVPADSVGGSQSLTSLASGEGFVAWYDPSLVKLFGRTISFSPSPTPSVSPSVSPTTTPTPPTTGGTPTPTSMPTSSPSVTPSPTTGFPTPSMMPTPTVTPVPSPATGTPMPSVTPSPYPSSTTTGMPSPASPTPVPSAGYTLKPDLLLLPASIISSIFNGVTTMVQSFWKYPS